MLSESITRPARVAVVILGGLVLIVALAVGGTAAVLPCFDSCHDSRTFTEQTAASAHASIECDRCHGGPSPSARVAFASYEIFGMGLGIDRAISRTAAQVPDTTCLGCHRDAIQGVVASRGVRIRHTTCAADSVCSDCHSNTAHGEATTWLRTVDMNRCLLCHGTDQVSRRCDMCHESKREDDRLQSGSWPITHGANWQTTHGMGPLPSCSACHEPEYCSRCHGVALPHPDSYAKAHAADVATNREDCLGCHETSFCDSCHGLQMPHPAGFTRRHSKLVLAEGDKACTRCHVSNDCDGCHVKHVHPGGALTRPEGSS